MNQSLHLGVFELAEVAIAIVGPDGRITDGNRALSDFLGFEKRDLVGRFVSTITYESPTTRPGRRPHELKRPASNCKDVIFLTRDGSTKRGRLMTAVIPGDDEETRGSVWVVAEATSPGSGQLSELASVIAHEVRNPLAGIRGAVDIIGDRLPASAPEQQILRAITQRIGELNEVIDGILHYARPVEPRRQKVPLLSCVSRAHEKLVCDSALGTTEVKVSGEEVEVEADPRLLELVFVKLLTNAANACRRGGEVLVEVRQSGRFGMVTIDDSGPGIPEDLRELIFEPFFTTRARGPGLGLPTARRMVESHGGRLSISNRAEGGARALVVLPIDASTE